MATVAPRLRWKEPMREAFMRGEILVGERGRARVRPKLCHRCNARVINQVYGDWSTRELRISLVVVWETGTVFCFPMSFADSPEHGHGLSVLRFGNVKVKVLPGTSQQAII